MLYIEDLASDAFTTAATGRIVDNGIGPFEFWGAKGVDHRLEFEADAGAADVTVPLAECGGTPSPEDVCGYYELDGYDVKVDTTIRVEGDKVTYHMEWEC